MVVAVVIVVLGWWWLSHRCIGGDGCRHCGIGDGCRCRLVVAIFVVVDRGGGHVVGPSKWWW